MSGPDPVEAFRLEAGELLDATEQALLDLSQDLASRDLIDTVFRGLHTLKGSGAMFGFDALAAFTHHCETIFDSVRKGNVPASAELVAVTLSAMDHIRTLIDDPDGEDVDTASAALLARIQALSGGDSGTAAAPAPGAPAPHTDDSAHQHGWHVQFRLPPDALMNGTNPLILLDELRDMGATNLVVDFSHVPPLDALDPTQCHLGWTMDIPSTATREEIEDVFIFVIDDMELSIRATDATTDSPVQAQTPDTMEGQVPNAVQTATATQAEHLAEHPGAKATRPPQ